MAELHFDFSTALLGEDGARELAQSFLDMGPEVCAELELFQGRDPLEVTRTLKARAAPPRVVPLFAPARREIAARRPVASIRHSQPSRTVARRRPTLSEDFAALGRDMLQIVRRAAAPFMARKVSSVRVAVKQSTRPGFTPYLATSAGRLTPQARLAGLAGLRAS